MRTIIPNIKIRMWRSQKTCSLSMTMRERETAIEYCCMSHMPGGVGRPALKVWLLKRACQFVCSSWAGLSADNRLQLLLESVPTHSLSCQQTFLCSLLVCVGVITLTDRLGNVRTKNESSRVNVFQILFVPGFPFLFSSMNYCQIVQLQFLIECIHFLFICLGGVPNLYDHNPGEHFFVAPRTQVDTNNHWIAAGQQATDNITGEKQRWASLYQSLRWNFYYSLPRRRQITGVTENTEFECAASIFGSRWPSSE